MQIIIDGYNLLHNVPRYALLGLRDLEAARELLLTDLSKYSRQNKHKITVVFDGWQGGQFKESQHTVRGVSVIYSRLGEKADEVIRRRAAEEKKELAVVTSDRGIIQTLESKEILVMPVEEFQRRMSQADYFSLKGEGAEAEESELPGKKKGNPRKLSKTERKKQKQWEKI